MKIIYRKDYRKQILEKKFGNEYLQTKQQMFDEYRKYVKQLIDIVTYKNKGTRESSFYALTSQSAADVTSGPKLLKRTA